MTGKALLAFTFAHVVLSLAGIAAGFISILGFLMGRHFRFWSSIFLCATAATCVTGFLFPFHGITPGIIVGIISLAVLAVALLAQKNHNSAAYISAVCMAEALNGLVLITQLFAKVPCLHHYAPTGREPIAAACQLIVFLLLATLAWVGVVRAKPH